VEDRNFPFPQFNALQLLIRLRAFLFLNCSMNRLDFIKTTLSAPIAFVLGILGIKKPKEPYIRGNDEVYAFDVKWNYVDGTKTPVYHLDPLDTQAMEEGWTLHEVMGHGGLSGGMKYHKDLDMGIKYYLDSEDWVVKHGTATVVFSKTAGFIKVQDWPLFNGL